MIHVPEYMTPRVNFIQTHPLGKIVRAYPTDAGADLNTVEDGSVAPGKIVKVRFGIAVEVPLTHVGLLCSRSGHGKVQVSLANSVGIIDTEYRGEVMGYVQNLGDKVFEFKAGDRLAQLLIMPVVLANFVLVEELSKTDRGAEGFGSTNK